MRFSVILPSFLGAYPTAARNRPEKLVRALRSCLTQSFSLDQFEVIVIADGCNDTFRIIETLPSEFEPLNLKCILIQKQGHFSGYVRNRGIADAQGDWIVYLDSDDCLGSDHLKTIDEEINRTTYRHEKISGTYVGLNPDWVWFNDIVFRQGKWQERDCKINIIGRHGTSNIAHQRALNIHWNGHGYAKDDTSFIRNLREKFPNFTKIKTPNYRVCHIPSIYDK